MKEEDKAIVQSKIAPLINKGEASLLLGAGFSYKNPTKDGELPDGEGLRNKILSACNKTPGPRTSLKDAYTTGKREIKNFDEFLANIFAVEKVHDWQEKIFQYTWNRIYTTNIDNVLNIAHLNTQKRGKTGGEYKFYNFEDQGISKLEIGTIPVVTIHGTCLKITEGFIFSSLDYAKASLKVLDWHNELAAKMLTGGLVVIGNQLDESDFDVHLSRRLEIYGASEDPEKSNWIVMPNPDTIKAENYAAAGFYVIDATAEDFFQTLFSIAHPKSIGEIILESTPSVRNISEKRRAMTWFKTAFKVSALEAEEANKKKGLLDHFIKGSHPEWFYIVNNAHARVSKIGEIIKISGDLLRSKEYGSGILHVTGPSGSGKTTAIRAALKELGETYRYIYEFNEFTTIDENLLQDIIEGFKEKSIFIFYSSSEYYYAINKITDRLKDRKHPFCLFILEARSNEHSKNKRHLTGSAVAIKTELGNLSFEDAKLIAQKIDSLGLKYEKFSETPIEHRAKIIINKERGYGGDLLSTLFSLTTHENFEQKIYQEYHSIKSKTAQKLLETAVIVNSFGLPLPLNYLIGLTGESLEAVTQSLTEDLAGILISPPQSDSIKCRHRVLADYYFRKCVSSSGSTDSIIEMLTFLSRQFSVDDIKNHPLPYRIYRELISFEFLFEKIFPKQTRNKDTELIYHTAQNLYGIDGVFWLHFGRYYRKMHRLDEAIECFKKGLTFYNSFHTRHLLGLTLIDRFIKNEGRDYEDYKEGAVILETERASRGANDSYPTTALLEALTRVLRAQPSNHEARILLSSTINYALRYFKDDEHCSRATITALKESTKN